MKSIKKLFIIVILLVVVVSMVVATASAENVAKDEKKNTGSIIGSKEKTVSYKITWNANGGKIGTKKTTVTNVKKGSKIAKLVTTPKRSGYTFMGWFTKKTGGTKITKNTKPIKSTTFFAQWKKTNLKALNSEEKKFLGKWTYEESFNDGGHFCGGKCYHMKSIIFNSDGTFIEISSERKLSTIPVEINNYMYKGNWAASGGELRFMVQNIYEGKDRDMKSWSLTSYYRRGLYLENYQFDADEKAVFMVGLSLASLSAKKFYKK